MSEIEVNDITFQLAAKLNGKSFVRSGKRRMKCWDEGYDEVLLSDDPKGFTMIKAASEFHHIVVDDDAGGKYWMGVLVFGPKSTEGKLNALIIKVGRVDKNLNPIEISEEYNHGNVLLDLIGDSAIIH
ncbi:hypothetical protein PQC65_gp048 [Aeromonas phage pAEv1810]|uniref:hypothetical protein n=1 Tax=Aeromonas phage pAEv1810 TaxID=2908744 RepID=UPI0023296F8C|nr:hypothetical protein PQC65_gp048 [Aeromonas phage pAEv1810]UIS24986.1 hypothetical protein pAEv1810_48 [Aeromonas phage pAEv1810]